MQSLWNDADAAQWPGELGARVYTSRLLGRDKTLVLHGGGNTSVKIREQDVFGEEQDVLYVKGSGWDLETIEPQGFSPVRLSHVLKLAQLPVLSDPDMVNQLATSMTRAGAPGPSIETILHGSLPYKYVDHTHADAVVCLSDTADGEARIRKLYGDRCVVIPYLMPGFDLARYCAEAFARERNANTIGMVLLKHGIFSFGDNARQAYERMIELVSMAEQALHSAGAWPVKLADGAKADGAKADNANIGKSIRDPRQQALLRQRLSGAAGAPMLMKTVSNARTLGFARHPGVAKFSQRGPVTPDHIIRTKRTPMLGTDVEAYVAEYQKYFETHAPQAKEPKRMLDPAPRLVLDPAFGLAALGRSAKDADIVEELYDHSIDVILGAETLGGYQPLPSQELFDVEYWDLEQAKLRKGGKPAVFAGEVALITGAASGIGKAAVTAFLARGAAVVGLDINPAITRLHQRADYLGLVCDLTDAAALDGAVRQAVLRFGGIDMLVLNAGIFPASNKLAALPMAEWQRAMKVNLDAGLMLLQACHPYLCCAPQGGRVTVIGSKNVPAPGPGAGAYSASKAALNQLARVAALEWGSDRIRINSLHPNAVFDTALWTPELLAQRAKAYGLSVEQYKTRNVLRIEVRSSDVAELAAEMCGPLFSRTTGAQLPIDGGDERVI